MTPKERQVKQTLMKNNITNGNTAIGMRLLDQLLDDIHARLYVLEKTAEMTAKTVNDLWEMKE